MPSTVTIDSSPDQMSTTTTPKSHRHSNRQTMLMDNARQSASFDSGELSYLLYGGKDALELQQTTLARVEKALGTSDTSKLPKSHANMDRIDAYREGLSFAKVLMEDSITHRHGLFNQTSHTHTLINSSPLGLHPGLFIPALKLQASQEQLDYWLPLAESGRIIGTYCQTELGHGTFLRGLETTATFDTSTDEFILHSPTLTSTKFWPGGLGFSSSHAIVMARLIVGPDDHGVHPFIVQLRSLVDYKPHEGIELGDIGLKMGLNHTDNGYAIFNRVRIPRNQLLMRNAQLSRDGAYNKASHDKLAYMTMIYGRYVVSRAVAFQLAQAVTIATRYSVVREQGVGNDPHSTTEIPIMAYRSQHYRLLTWMARAFALVFASQKCGVLYDNLVSGQSKDDHSGLAYVHCTTAALKAYATRTASEGAEDARKCCGGHGYLLISGLPDIVATVASTTTLEGENYVMYQQAARYLIKCAAAVRIRDTVNQPMKYLSEDYPSITSSETSSWTQSDFLQQSVLLSLFRYRAMRLIFECEQLLHEAQSGPQALSSADAWNEHTMALIEAATAHTELYVLESYISTLRSADISSTTRVALTHLLTLYTHTTLTTSPSFLSHSPLQPVHLRMLRSNISDALKSLLPDSIALTDSWAFTDGSLRSALGMKDGNVYERIMEWTRQVPLNLQVKADGERDSFGFDKYIKPIIRAKL